MSKKTTITKIGRITPQDLRIGNLVHLRHSDYVNVMEVTAIGQKNIAARFKEQAESSIWSYEEIEPIPLTDGIMGKCGFEKVDANLWICDFCYAEIGSYDDAAHVQTEGYSSLCTIRCRYLHELQNCYFAITGEELDVKL